MLSDVSHIERITDAWSAYIGGRSSQSTHDRLDLRQIAAEHPAEVWSFLRTRLADLSDEVLALLAIDIVDLFRIHGGDELWRTVGASAVSSHSLQRMVAALDRYRAEEELLSALLAEKPVSLRPFGIEDLLIPNPYDRGLVASDPEARVREESKAGFLGNDPNAWEEVQWLCDASPEAAFELGIDLLAAATVEQVSWVGITLFEGLLTLNESLLSQRALAELRSNCRFRAALSCCYLNPSETFLHQLITTLHASVRGA